MRYLKMLGIAGLGAMALMAILGTGSASATVLCETQVDHCGAGWDLEKGDSFTYSLKSGTEAALKAAFSEVRCKKSDIEVDIIDTGGHNTPVIEDITAISTEECKCGERTSHVTTTEAGTMSVNDAGTVTSTGTRFTIQCTGLASCIYGTVAAGTDIGSFTEGSPAAMDVSATLTWSSGTGDSGQFVCAGFGDTGTWTASYECTGTENLWISTT